MDLGLKNRTALITGGSEGIGRAIALRLAQEGANIVVCARREEPLKAVAAEIEAFGVGAVAVSCDVTDPQASTNVLAAAQEKFPGIDILINNAGTAKAIAFLNTTDEDWVSGIDMNFMSTVRFTRACLPWMVEQQWGRIVNVASTFAKLGDPNHSIYGATKAAMMNFSKTMSNAYATDGVRCNCILPGVTMTPLIEGNVARAAERTGRTPDDILGDLLKRNPIPVGRFGRPDDIADMVAFLSSDRSEWITGVSLPIDGGTIPVAG